MTVSYTHRVLTAGEAARYTYENVVREGDNWDPKKYMEQISAPENLKKMCIRDSPKGAVIDFQGNVFEGVSIQFTIRERPQPEARIFDAVVSPDGKGNYTSIQKAIANVPSKRTEPWLIFVANGRCV